MEPLSDSSLGPFLNNEFGDRYLFSINRETFNKVGSHSLYQQHFGQDFFREKTLHLIVGLDSGLCLDYLLQKGLPEGSRYLFIDLPEVLARLEKEGLFSNLDEHIAFISKDEFLSQTEKFQFRSYLYTEKVMLWQSFACVDAFLPEYPELYWHIRDAIDTLAWNNKVQLGNQIFIQRQLENLPESRLSAKSLQGIFSGKTAVLLAGGPSLDDVLPWVKRHRDHIVVLAVSRIARRLREVGLSPDIFFSVDPHPISFDVSKEMLTFWENSLFIYKNHVSPPLLSQWRGRSMFIGTRYPWEAESCDDYLQGPGPTVTNTAFAVAVEMGFSHIILAGVDLCFSREGNSHAKGSNEILAGPQFSHFDTRVPTNDGSMAFTMRSMAEAIPSLGSQASAALEKGCHTINPAPGAAKIPGVSHKPLEDILFDPLPRPGREMLDSVLTRNTENNRRSYYKDALKELETVRRKIHQIGKLAASGLKCNDGLFGRNGMQQDFKYKKRMDKVEKALNGSSLRACSRLLKQYGLRHFVKIDRPDTDKEWTDDDIENTGRIYYQAYKDSASQFMKLIEMAEARLTLRMQEDAPSPDISALVENWRKNGEPGRALVFSQRHPHMENTPELLKSIEEFQCIIQNEDTEHFRKRRSDADPKIARTKINILFNNQDVNALSGVIDGLTAMEGTEAKAVHSLASGYLAELNENPAAALEHYNKVIETSLPLPTEDALRRIASLSLELQDAPNALLALECLSGISPIYLPQYAALAKLLGDFNTALNAYADYLAKFPDDKVTLIKVGKLYLEMGQTEPAETVFRYLLEKDPEDKTARILLDKTAKHTDP